MQDTFPYKGLVSKAYKELVQLSNNHKLPNDKMGKRLENFFGEDIRMANKHMQRCPTSLDTRERQIKTARHTAAHPL